MTYFRIRSIGDFTIVEPLEDDKTVFEKDGNFFFKETHTDFQDDEYSFDVQVYASKKDAWNFALKTLDDHIARMQRIRENVFHKALDDGAFQKTPEEVKKWMDSIRGEESTDLFEKRNKVK